MKKRLGEELHDTLAVLIRKTETKLFQNLFSLSWVSGKFTVQIFPCSVQKEYWLGIHTSLSYGLNTPQLLFSPK